MEEPKKLPFSWKGPFSAFFIFFTTYAGSIFCLVQFVPLAIFAPTYWRYWTDRWVGFWESFPVALLEFFYGSKVQVSGDPIAVDEPAIIIMNHRTRLDWLYFWSALYKMDPRLLITEKISLKSNLKKIPGAGWAMQCNGFIFLERKKDSDLKMMEDAIEYYSKIGTAYQLLIFPEGTDLSDYNREKSRVYAAENGLEDYDFLLQPRTTGLVHLVETMKKKNYFKCIYDVTVAYGDAIIASEMDFIKGNCPLDIRFHVRKYAADQLPSDIADWSHRVWSRKDRILRSFYESKTRDFTRMLQSVEQANPVHPEDGSRGPDHCWPDRIRGLRYTGLVTSFLFWVYFATVWIVLTCYLRPFFYYAVIFSSVFLLFQKFHNGLELWVVKQYISSHKKSV